MWMVYQTYPGRAWNEDYGALDVDSHSLGLMCTTLRSEGSDTISLIPSSASRFISMYPAGIQGRKTSSAER